MTDSRVVLDVNVWLDDDDHVHIDFFGRGHSPGSVTGVDAEAGVVMSPRLAGMLRHLLFEVRDRF